MALRGLVTTQMGVTGAAVKMATPTMESKGPGAPVGSLSLCIVFQSISDYFSTTFSTVFSSKAFLSVELNCGRFSTESGSVPVSSCTCCNDHKNIYYPLVDCRSVSQSLPGLANIKSILRNNCLTLTNAKEKPVKGAGEMLLEVRQA